MDNPDLNAAGKPGNRTARIAVMAAISLAVASYAALAIALVLGSSQVYAVAGGFSVTALLILIALVFSSAGRKALWPIDTGRTGHAILPSIWPEEFFWHIRFQLYLSLVVLGSFVLIGGLLEPGLMTLPVLLLGVTWPISHPVFVATICFNARMASHRPSSKSAEQFHQQFLPKAIREGRAKYFKVLDEAANTTPASPNPDADQSED